MHVQKESDQVIVEGPSLSRLLPPHFVRGPIRASDLVFQRTVPGQALPGPEVFEMCFHNS